MDKLSSPHCSSEVSVCLYGVNPNPFQRKRDSGDVGVCMGPGDTEGIVHFILRTYKLSWSAKDFLNVEGHFDEIAIRNH